MILRSLQATEKPIVFFDRYDLTQWEWTQPSSFQVAQD